MTLSIITINYNNALGLEKTIQSVLDQTYTDFEYIIIDGGSTDGSLDTINKYSNRINYWVSENDKGIYNAINKGIFAASGKYIYIVNSGDCLYNNNVLEKVIPTLNNEDIIYGNLLIEENNNRWIKTYPKLLNFSYFLYDTLPHSGGVFILKESFNNSLSIYDEELMIVSDWKWFLIAIFKFNYSYKYINTTIGIFDFSGLSAKPENKNLIHFEKTKVLRENFSGVYEDIYDLLDYKNKYLSLTSSRYFKLSSKLKQFFKF